MPPIHALMERYIIHECQYRLSPVEVQQLGYFLRKAGEPFAPGVD